MDYWQIIKLATDTGLVLSLVFLLYRFLRSNEVAPQNNSRIVEAQVARMLQDAEVAGRELSQVLEKRQRALKETLNQIESTESRIKQSLLKRAKEKEKPAQQTSQVSKDIETESPPKYEGVNIFGEKIGVGPTETQKIEVMPAQAPAPKSLRIRPEVVTVADNTERDLQRIYEQAEALLRAGKDIESVTMETRLSNSEVKMLSELVARESVVANEPKSEAAPRLGGMRRLVQTV